MNSVDLSRINVLVVDDNPHFLSIMRTMLRGMGVRNIVETTSATKAVELVGQRPFDIAFIDRIMPDMDGLTLARKLRCVPEATYGSMPIILITADGRKGTVMQAINCGIEEVLLKPVSTTQLHRRLRRLISKPHSYIRTPGYAGPDRRRRDDPSYRGPERRQQAVEDQPQDFEFAYLE